MFDKDCGPDHSCCAPPPLQFSASRAVNATPTKIPAAGCADDACGCHSGVPRFDEVDPHYKLLL